MDKLKYVKIENEDGSLSDNIPLGVDAENVDISSNNFKNLLDYINENDNQIDNLKNSNISLSNQIKSLSSGSPKGTYASVEALETANPETGVYVVTENGHIYSWTKDVDSAIDLGVYQATSINDKEITVRKLSDSLKDSLNLYIPDYSLYDGYYTLNGILTVNTNFNYTSPIKLLKGQKIKANVRAYNTMSVFVSCDSTGNNIKSLVVGIDNISLDYEYIATEDCYIIVSGAKDIFSLYIEKIDKTKEEIDKTKEEINNVKEEIENINIPNIKNVPLLSIFESIGIIGDSHTAGAIEGEGSHDNHNLATMSQVCKQCGNTSKFYARSGESTKSWLDYNYNVEECKAYVIALGSNDRTASYPIGNSSDIASSTPSFYYYYNQIINKIKGISPNAKIFLFSLYGNDTDPASIPYNDAIKYFADNIENCFFVDMRNSYTIYQDYKIGGHMSAIGYTFIADYVINQTNNLIQENYTDFNDVGIY